jgi:hypothetical protein
VAIFCPILLTYLLSVLTLQTARGASVTAAVECDADESTYNYKLQRLAFCL